MVAGKRPQSRKLHRVMVMRMHYYLANGLGNEKLKEFWDWLESMIRTYQVKVVMGDFNMCLFRVIPEVRSCGSCGPGEGHITDRLCVRQFEKEERRRPQLRLNAIVAEGHSCGCRVSAGSWRSVAAGAHTQDEATLQIDCVCDSWKKEAMRMEGWRDGGMEGWARERETERERQTERDREREREGERERKSEREREMGDRERRRDRERGAEKERERERDIDYVTTDD